MYIFELVGFVYVLNCSSFKFFLKFNAPVLENLVPTHTVMVKSPACSVPAHCKDCSSSCLVNIMVLYPFNFIGQGWLVHTRHGI